MRPIARIIIHCLDTYADQDVDVAEVRRWHMAQGWQDIGYAYLIKRDGTIEQGRPESRVGAHVKGHNHDSIGVAMAGGRGKSGRPECNFTRHQWAALDHLVTQLLVRHPGAEVSGHNDWTEGKACPTFSARDWWYGSNSI